MRKLTTKEKQVLARFSAMIDKELDGGASDSLIGYFCIRQAVPSYQLAYENDVLALAAVSQDVNDTVRDFKDLEKMIQDGTITLED